MADEAKRVRVLTIGSANMDMVLRMKRVPAAGETIVDREGGLSYIPGGKGANCAVAAAKMGAISQFCGGRHFLRAGGQDHQHRDGVDSRRGERK